MAFQKTITLPEDLKEYIETEMKKEHRPFSNMMEKLIRMGISEYEREKETIMAIRSGSTQIDPSIVGK